MKKYPTILETLKEASEKAYQKTKEEIKHLEITYNRGEDDITLSVGSYIGAFSSLLTYFDHENNQLNLIPSAIIGFIPKIEASTFLAIHGLYLEAICNLRDGFDRFLNYVYFYQMQQSNKMKDYYVDKENKFVDWKENLSEEQISNLKPRNAYTGWICRDEKIYLDNKDSFKAPRYNSIIDELKTLLKEESFVNEIETIYNSLSNFSHGRGEISVGHASFGNPHFNEKAFLYWNEKINQITKIVFTILAFIDSRFLENKNQQFNFNYIYSKRKQEIENTLKLH